MPDSRRRRRRRVGSAGPACVEIAGPSASSSSDRATFRRTRRRPVDLRRFDFRGGRVAEVLVVVEAGATRRTLTSSCRAGRGQFPSKSPAEERAPLEHRLEQQPSAKLIVLVPAASNLHGEERRRIDRRRARQRQHRPTVWSDGQHPRARARRRIRKAQPATGPSNSTTTADSTPTPATGACAAAGKSTSLRARPEREA